MRSAQLMLEHAGPAAPLLAELQGVRALQAELPDPGGEAATLARISTLQRQAGQHAPALASAREALARAGQGHNPLETYQSLDAPYLRPMPRWATRARRWPTPSARTR
ncbi:hypothetical protein H1235_07395 [Pseudoxanthomonas sp. NC8]|nr:hypothetical protein H1235_07395 [Pseudoxanthomonas sp. NC8]